MTDIKAKHPLKWYRDEISRTYARLKEAYKNENRALHLYNSLMISCAETIYKATAHKDKDAKRKAKDLYDICKREYLNVVDAVAKRKALDEYLRELQQERKEVYDNEGEPRE